MTLPFRSQSARLLSGKPKRPRSARPPRGPSEHDIQAAFFKMVRAVPHPASRLSFAAVNGAVGGSMRRIAFFQAEGLVAGVPDVIILWPSRGAHFAAIEFKKPGEYARPNQEAFLQGIIVAGGAAEVFTCAEAAFRWWCWYVGLTDERPPAG